MGHFSELPVVSAKEAFDSKFWGQYITVRAALPYLNHESSITLTSGVYGVSPPQGATTLAAINSAIEGLVRGLSIDLAPIRVNVVSPGIVDTPIYAGMPDDQRQELFHGIAQQLPVGRIAQPQDIAESYVYLAKNGNFTRRGNQSASKNQLPQWKSTAANRCSGAEEMGLKGLHLPG
jgi:NAD(P)-dependent dehydrogenase (short-subunit alcohol dehydrogenase family)